MRPKPRKQRNEDYDDHKEAERDDPYNRLVTQALALYVRLSASPVSTFAPIRIGGMGIHTNVEVMADGVRH